MNLLKLAATSIGKKTIMAVSGLLLALFLLTHAVGTSTIFAGWQIFRAYAAQLHRFPKFILAAEIFLAAVFLIHITFALLVFLENHRARQKKYIAEKKSGNSWGYSTMPHSGIIILFFVAIHLFNVDFSNTGLPMALRLMDTFRQPLFVAFYTMALLALFLHVSHGFWSLLQTLGFDHPKYGFLIQTATRLLALAICTVFILIPLMIFVSAT